MSKYKAKNCSKPTLALKFLVPIHCSLYENCLKTTLPMEPPAKHHFSFTFCLCLKGAP